MDNIFIWFKTKKSLKRKFTFPSPSPPSPVSYEVNDTQASLVDSAGLVPEHCNKESVTVKQVTPIYWFSSIYKSYVHTIT